VPLLEALGHGVVTPDLPGLGADKTPASAVTLQTYADRVCEIVKAQKEKVVLVGHSMGGAVITQAAEQCHDNLAALIYLTAFLPQNGQSLQHWAAQDAGSMVNPATLDISRDHLTAQFREDAVRDAFYGKCSAADAAYAQSQLVPQALAPLGTPVAITAERYGRVPRFYVECSQDRAITPWLQQQMYAASPCQEVFTIDTDHSPFLSTPEALAGILARVPTTHPANPVK
jgi:pimeloyl-ACP methyl ester carboxylesterase